MLENKTLYWSFQSSQLLNPTDTELEIFQRKYKKDFEQRIVFEGDELTEKFRLNGWRNALFSEITSIILAFEHQGTLRVKYITGTEKDLLQNFVNIVKNDFKEYQLAHFDAGIVLPYIGVRLQKNGFINSPHIGLKYQGCRPWDLKGLDLKQHFKGAGDYSYSLEEIAYILNINSEGIIPYEDEFTYYNSGDFESLNNSAIKKIELLSKIHRILLELPQLETVLVREKVEAVEEVKPTNFLTLLFESQAMTLEVRNGLEKQLKKKKLTKRDREVVREIILGVYISSDFINGQQDSKATIEKKIKEVDEFLNTI